MKRSRLALVLLATAGALALVFTSATFGGTTKKAASPYKVALILVGPHNDGGWSQAHYAGMQYVQKALGSKVQFTTKENIAPGAQLNQTVASLSSQGYKMIFATSYGMVTKARCREVSEHPVRAGDGHGSVEEPGRVLRPGRGHRLPLRDGGRRGEQDREDRLRRRVPDPRGDPARERVRARCPADAPGRDGQPRLDELVVRSDQGEEGRPEPRRGRRGRARAERRLAGGGPVRRDREGAVGRLRLRFVEVRAEVVADGRDVQLGPVHAEAGQGGDGGNVEVGLLLREHQRRLHRAREVRADACPPRRRRRSPRT